ncbi:DEAD/DEAH box helicase family protein [Myroides pelagicus]|uniref:Restriction endonuclease subunit R n=1 Tax=Myroides pelagicus TaxID=270914 RepID=A0A7K1GQK2_9FLAO|nr:DEAD/DEAH box helicase family protein [Myroides pelagicus]MTH31000.1 restriction endonuclease subunit R [Myroides pelagicus]
MEELITPFNDYPIEFKELNPEDFESFNVPDKIIIEPNTDGYINEVLQNAIELSTKNTVVVNAGVGQGKTYSIIQLVKKYYDLEGEEYVIFIASPYMSLVQQYYNKTIDSGIPENKIYRYENIGVDRDINPIDSRVHILTVNALLGNPGEDALINSQAKRDYINAMVKYCEDNNKKAVFIYDEIHDAIHNFKEEYIFTLWKWRNVIHKNLIISATFNEASKIVIQYLANLTDKKIQLIESKRIRVPENQSDLYLHYNNNLRYYHNDESIVNLVESLIAEGKDVDILSYSKNLADNICKNTTEENSIGNILIKKYGEIQNCTTGLDNNQRPNREIPTNRYDSSKCNVGTNFKTGISIEKENHAFVIIMPPKGAKSLFKNGYGIFTDGINAIIQAFARQRKKGEIHVILPSPDIIDYSTVPFFSEEDKIKVFRQLYTNGKEASEGSENLVKYIPINNQKNILEDYYNDVYRKNVEDELEFFNTSEILHTPEIRFPSLERFIITSGEKYLVNKYPFFGGDLSSIVTYYAITNQFINCRLVKIHGKSGITVNQETLVEDLTRSYSNIIESDYYQNALYYTDLFVNNDLNNFWRQEENRDENYFSNILDNTDREFYMYLRNALFEHFNINMLRTNGQIITVESTSNNKYIEQAILAVYHNYRYSPYYSINTNGDSFAQPYTRADYFRANILHAINLSNKIQEGLIGVEDSTEELIDAYMSMKYFISKITVSNTTIRSGSRIVNYIPVSPDADFIFITEDEYPRFNRMIDTLLAKDYFIKNNIFDFKLGFTRQNSSMSDKIKYFYNVIKEAFFKGNRYRINNEEINKNVHKVTEEFFIEDHQLIEYPNFLNLLNS